MFEKGYLTGPTHTLMTLTGTLAVSTNPQYQRARRLAAGTLAQAKVSASPAEEAMKLVEDIYPRLREMVVENAITAVLEAFVQQEVKFSRLGFIPTGPEVAVMVSYQDDDEQTAVQVVQIIAAINMMFYKYDLYLELTLLEDSDGWPELTNLSCINYTELNG